MIRPTTAWTTVSAKTDYPAPVEAREIQWRLRRGMRELDLLLTAFYQRRWQALDSAQRQVFRDFLQCEDDCLWDWLSERDDPEDERFTFIVDDIRRHAGC